MPVRESKVPVGAIWLGPLAERAQVLEALKQYHLKLKRRIASLPKQRDSQYQWIADHVSRKLDPAELTALPDQVIELTRYFQNQGKDFLAALEAGGQAWEWDIAFTSRGKRCVSSGWCVEQDGQIIATLCYTAD